MDQCVLYIPHMWQALFAALTRGNNAFHNLVCPYHPLEVSETGLEAPRYSTILESCERTHCVPILLLPVTHCSLNIDDAHLRILGPAIATQNDIFIFRLASQYQTTYPYWIAVKDFEITTTNLLRIVLANWCPNFIDHTVAGMDDPIIECVETIRKAMPNMYKLDVQKGVTERITAMQETHHAAVFMGEDLNVPPDTPGVSDGGKSLFDDDRFIDIMNINRVINRIYSVKWFPRAVFVTFRHFENDTMINRFCDTYNSALPDITTHDHPESAHQKLCRTGKLSDTGLARTLIKFTKDIHSPMIMQMRKERFGRGFTRITKGSRALKATDFTWCTHIFRHDFDRILLELVEKRYSTLEGGGLTAKYNEERQKALATIQKDPPRSLDEFRNTPNTRHLRTQEETLWSEALVELDAVACGK